MLLYLNIYIYIYYYVSTVLAKEVVLHHILRQQTFCAILVDCHKDEVNLATFGFGDITEFKTEVSDCLKSFYVISFD